MATISREKLKVRGFKRLKHSIKYSIEGLVYAYKHEQSMLLHFIGTVLVIILGIIFEVSHFQWLILALSLTVILVVELFNTAIEAIVDLITLELNPLAKVAKDCGSAAAFVVTLITIGISLTIFVPKIIEMFK